MDPCGSDGCILPPSTDHITCEALCNNTTDCIGYVFSYATCEHKANNTCWLKVLTV